MQKNAWPYVAGMLDAEGTIQVAVDRRPNGIVGMVLQITIANTELKLMKWLVSNFGGKFYRRPNNRNGYSTPLSPDIYFWFVLGKSNKEAFLLGILPYLTAKKQEAILGLEFIRLGGGWNKEKRLQLAAEIKAAKVCDVDKDRKQALVKFTPAETSAFVAGLFDGDGSIGSTIELTQKRLILMRWMLMNCGGRFDERQMAGKTYFRWRLSGRKNKHDFLLDVIPHLILKKDKAKSLLASLRASEQGSATTDMLGAPQGVKTQSELAGDSKSASEEIQKAINAM